MNETTLYLLEIMDQLYKRGNKRKKAATKQTANKSK